MLTKKKLALALAAVLASGSMAAMPVSASVTDSVASTTYAVFDKDSTNECLIEAARHEQFMVTIPKLVVLDGKLNTAGYTVNVAGDISGEQTVKVVPDVTFTMNEAGGKAPVTATVSQAKTSWDFADVMVLNAEKTAYIGTDAAGDIAAPLTAGKWKGNFNFNIKLLDNGDGAEEKTVMSVPGYYKPDGTFVDWDTFIADYPDAVQGDTLVADNNGDSYFAELEGSLVLGANIKVVGNQALSDCTKLEFVSMPEVESVGDAAFYGCTNLKTIVFGNNTKEIEICAFEGSGIESAYYNGIEYTSAGATLMGFSANGIELDEWTFYGIETSFMDLELD